MTTASFLATATLAFDNPTFFLSAIDDSGIASKFCEGSLMSEHLYSVRPLQITSSSLGRSIVAPTDEARLRVEQIFKLRHAAVCHLQPLLAE